MAVTNLQFNFLTWNATGIMSSASYLCECLKQKNIDICGISEHWLYEKDLQFLKQIDNSYMCHAVSDLDLKRPSRRRVGKGGVAILWHKKYDNYVIPLSLDDDRVIGIKFEINRDNSIFLFQVYLPCTNHSIDMFKGYLDRLQNILSLYSEKGTVVLMGDFNAYLPIACFRERADHRSLYFQSFVHDNNMLSLNTSKLCTGANSTFVTYDGRYESLIDYILIPVEKMKNVTYCEILDDSPLNVSRHRPVCCSLTLPTCLEGYASVESGPTINWKKVDQDCVNNYQNKLQNSDHLQSISRTDINSNELIDQAYKVLTREITAAAQKSFPIKSFKRFLKPYWNQELRNLHNKMKTQRHIWVSKGKPRGIDHASYQEYKEAKRDFRRCHRKIADQFLQSQIDEIDRVAEIDSGHFWRLVNARRKSSNSSPGTELIFNGQTFNTSKEINKEWAHYFRDLYTPTQNKNFDSNFYDLVSNEIRRIEINLENSRESLSYPIISPEEVGSAIKMTHSNKAGGDDEIVYEHIKYGGTILLEILSKFYTAILRFAYAPKDMKKGVIVTPFKGGGRRKDNPDNYRAITLSSVVLKLLERILLTRIELFDAIKPPIHPLQGGFKKQQGCLMTSFLVKEAIQFAKEKGSKVYACFLDVRKAFDQVWHDGLFYKLII